MYQRKFKEYFKEVLTFQKYSIYDTGHSVIRYRERVGDNMFLYEKLLKKGILYVIKNDLTSTTDRYIFYSNKYKFGIQVEWRLNRDGIKFGGYSATTLSESEMKFFTKKDKKILLENIQRQGETLEKSKLIFEKGYCRFEYPTKEFQKEMDQIYYNMFVESNEIYYDFELIKL